MGAVNNNSLASNEPSFIQEPKKHGRNMMIASGAISTISVVLTVAITAIALTILFAPFAAPVLAAIGALGVKCLVGGALVPLITAALALGLFYGGRKIQEKADIKAIEDSKAALEDAVVQARNEFKAAQAAWIKASSQDDSDIPALENVYDESKKKLDDIKSACKEYISKNYPKQSEYEQLLSEYNELRGEWEEFPEGWEK